MMRIPILLESEANQSRQAFYKELPFVDRRFFGLGPTNNKVIQKQPEPISVILRLTRDLP